MGYPGPGLGIHAFSFRQPLLRTDPDGALPHQKSLNLDLCDQVGEDVRAAGVPHEPPLQRTGAVGVQSFVDLGFVVAIEAIGAD